MVIPTLKLTQPHRRKPETLPTRSIGTIMFEFELYRAQSAIESTLSLMSLRAKQWHRLLHSFMCTSVEVSPSQPRQALKPEPHPCPQFTPTPSA